MYCLKDFSMRPPSILILQVISNPLGERKAGVVLIASLRVPYGALRRHSRVSVAAVHPVNSTKWS